MLKLKNLSQSFALRHAVSVSLLVVTAMVVNAYCSFSHEYWIVLVAFLASQTTAGTPFRQTAYLFSIAMAAFLFISFLSMAADSSNMRDAITAIIFLTSSYILITNRPYTRKSFYLHLYFAFVFLLLIFMPLQSARLMQARMLDAIMGGLLAILFCQFVFPVRIYSEFSRGLVPVLSALADYSHTFSECFLRRGYDHKLLDKKKYQLEIALQTQQGIYPEWVHEIGFNPGLRAGYRFYLVNVERVAEIFLSMGHLANAKINADLLNDLAEPISTVMQKNEELLDLLQIFFKNHKLLHTDSDYIGDMKTLENSLQRVTPGSLELLDISPEYITLTAIVRDLKDLRGILLQLVMALPTAARIAT